MTEAMSSVLSKSKKTVSHNPIQEVKFLLMGSRVAFELLQAMLGSHYHSQPSEESDRWKIILDHFSEQVSCSWPSVMQPLRLKKISSE